MRVHIVTTVCSALIGLAVLSSPASAEQKTIKQCEDEWRSSRDENRAKGITQKAYVEKCRADSAEAPKAKPQPATAVPSKPTETPAPAPKKAPAPASKTVPTGANQFQTEAQAKNRCPTDTVVWVNSSTKVYHFAGYNSYGKTKQGAYMCEKDATTDGMRASKREKHP